MIKLEVLQPRSSRALTWQSVSAHWWYGTSVGHWNVNHGMASSIPCEVHHQVLASSSSPPYIPEALTLETQRCFIVMHVGLSSKSKACHQNHIINVDDNRQISCPLQDLELVMTCRARLRGYDCSLS